MLAGTVSQNVTKCTEDFGEGGQMEGEVTDTHVCTNAHTISFSLSLTHTHIEANTLSLRCSSGTQRNGTVHCFEKMAHTHTRTQTYTLPPPLFLTHTSVSLRVYHDDPCHKGEALNKTRVIGGGEDAKITKQLKTEALSRRSQLQPSPDCLEGLQ